MSEPIYSHHHRKKTVRSKEFYPQTSLSQVINLNTRTKLPPIKSAIRGTYAAAHPDWNAPAHTGWSAANVPPDKNVRFPRVSRDSTNLGTRVGGEALHSPRPEGAPSWPKIPEFYFPRTYSVLPPIGKSVSLVSSQQTPGVLGEKVLPTCKGDQKHGNQPRKPSITRKEEKGLLTKHEAAKTSAALSTQAKSTYTGAHGRLNRSLAITDKVQKQTLPQDPAAHLSSIALIETGVEERREQTSAAQSEIQAITPPVKVKRLEDLERLELCTEARKFFETPHAHRRREATCTGLDPSLITVIDTIRDILLRQAMEELCMMW